MWSESSSSIRSYQSFAENGAVILGTEEDSHTMIPSVRQQTTRNRSNHHPTSYNSVMTRCNSRGNKQRTTHINSYKRTTMRDNSIYCLRNPTLPIILPSTFPQNTISHNWTRISMTSIGIQPFIPLQIPLLSTAILLASRLKGTWAHHSLLEHTTILGIEENINMFS
jgi:hypothetical protein